MHQFRASQNLNLRVPHEALPIEHYLRQPQRLVEAITDPNYIEQLEAGIYRLSLRPIQFLGLSVEPTADLEVWVLADGTLCLRSVNCEVRGPAYLNYLNQSFTMVLTGSLRPQRHLPYTELQGQADLMVQLELPSALIMPTAIIDRAGGKLLGGILASIKNRLERQLVNDYRSWVVQSASAAACLDSGKATKPHQTVIP
ncbi:MAG: DUF1997 domain-containing protein [Cyanobacteria bacterium REEB459]|nr:DUF1997 domain-containing protein [Cyanobacteria bacterium REEB459]